MNNICNNNVVTLRRMIIMQEYIWVLCEELDPTECWDETNTKNIWVFTDFGPVEADARQSLHGE